MEYQKKSIVEKCRGDGFNYCLEFLESYEIMILKQIKNRRLLKIIHGKKFTKDFVDRMKAVTRTRQDFDFPPDCSYIKHKKLPIISRFCLNCSKFICNSCFENCLNNNKNKSLSFYTCKNKKHKGSHKNFDSTCESCNSTICINCLNLHKVGNIEGVNNLKEYCNIKVNEQINKLKTIEKNYLNFFKSLDSFLQNILDRVKTKYANENHNIPNMEICLANNKNSLKNELCMKLEKLLSFIHLKIYGLSSIEEIELNMKEYEKIYELRINRFVKFAIDVDQIKNLKIGENFKMIIEEYHQYADFTKFSSEKISEMIKNIPSEGISTYGLCGDYKHTYPCFACKKQGNLTKFWHSGSKSNFSLNYVCDTCECHVYYDYDWSGAWD